MGSALKENPSGRDVPESGSRRETSRGIQKIAFFDAYCDAYYGAQQSMLTLARSLDPRKFEPTFVATRVGLLTQRFGEAGIPCKILPIDEIANVFGGAAQRYSAGKKVRVAVAIVKQNLRVLRWLRREGIDIVYANELRSLLYAGFAARVSGCVLVWYVRDESRLGRLHGMGIRLAHKVICVSRSVWNAFTARERHRHAQKLSTLYTGFDLSRYRYDERERFRLRDELGICDRTKVVGLVGSISPRKGQAVLVEAAPAILGAAGDVVFVAIGDVAPGQEAYAEEVKRRIAKLGIEDRFHWCGYRSDAEAFYSLMDVLVLPSSSEGLPRTVIEALACGVPVVATDVGGVREILLDGHLGDIVEVNEAAQLAERTTRVLSEGRITPQSREAMRSSVTERFSIESYAREFERLLEDSVT
jgi:glycosyltransferase involved in cell wall biosynthesis